MREIPGDAAGGRGAPFYHAMHGGGIKARRPGGRHLLSHPASDRSEKREENRKIFPPEAIGVALATPASSRISSR
jgi:hypothetical protein